MTKSSMTHSEGSASISRTALIIIGASVAVGGTLFRFLMRAGRYAPHTSGRVRAPRRAVPSMIVESRARNNVFDEATRRDHVR
jgi:hypothetical protein